MSAMTGEAPFEVIDRAGGAIRIGRLIGRTGEALVHEATVAGAPAAVRLFMPEHILRSDPNGGVALVDPRLKTDFARGLGRFRSLGQRLSREWDPSWLRVRESFLANGAACWLTDAPPTSLAKAIRKDGWLAPTEVMNLATRLAVALETLHRVTPHLDLALETVGLVDRKPVLMHPSTDRRHFMRPLGHQRGMVRSGYSAIEQYDGAMRAPVDEITDIHGASALLVALITRADPPPFKARLDGGWKLAATAAPGYPPAFLDAVERGFAVRRSDRFATVAQWREALAGAAPGTALVPVVADEPDTTSAVAPLKGETRSEAWMRRVIGGAVVVGLGGAAIAGAVAIWPGGETYYATRQIILREEPHPRKGEILARPDRGYSFRGRPAGEHNGIPWVRVTSGQYKDLYVSRRNVSEAPPPELIERLPEPTAARTLRTGRIYAAPSETSQLLGPLEAGRSLTRTGEVAGGWTEILWEKGGAAYVRSDIFVARPPTPAPVFTPPTTRPEPVPAPAVEPAPKAETPAKTLTPPRPPATKPRTQESPAPSNPSSNPRSAPTPTPPPVAKTPITKPVWTRTPTARQLFAATPPALITDNVRARIVVDCEVSPTGLMQDCFLVSETPKGYGLVDAAQNVLANYVMGSRDGDGQPTAGRRYRISMRLGVR